LKTAEENAIYWGEDKEKKRADRGAKGSKTGRKKLTSRCGRAQPENQETGAAIGHLKKAAKSFGVIEPTKRE